ncbi:MAG: ABC transporter ATP-binding protein [Pontibacterium sp.]
MSTKPQAEAQTKATAQSRQRAFKLLSEYVYKDKAKLISVVVLLILATAADVVGPIIGKVYIDDYLMVGNYDLSALSGLLALYLVTQFGAAWLRYQQTLRCTDIALDAVKDIRRRAFDHVLKLPISYFDKALTGQVVTRITNDTESIKDLYVQFLSVVFGNSVLLIGILIAMAVLNIKLMLAALLLIPAVVGLIYLYERFSGPAVQEARSLRSDINGFISESISGMPVIQTNRQTQAFGTKFATINDAYYVARMRTLRASAALLRPAIDLMSVIVLLAVITAFGVQVTEGVAEIGVLYAYLSLLGRFTEPLAEITQRFNLYQQAMVAGERVDALLNKPTQIWGNHSRTAPEGELIFEQMSFAYHADKPVIPKLDLRIQSGEFFAIVGHTGSGKSTLLNLMLNFYQPQQGQLLLDGRRLQDYSQKALADSIALVPQEPFIIAGTLADNIDMGRNLDSEAITYAAEQAQLKPLIEQLPQGLNTLLGERGTRLSTGQRQQLVIARALAASPKILLLDEATANIDTQTEQAVQAAIGQLRGKVTLIVVAHRLSTIKDADRIAVMAKGEVIEMGSHTQLMGDTEGTYYSMYQLQKQAQAISQAAE